MADLCVSTNHTLYREAAWSRIAAHKSHFATLELQYYQLVAHTRVNLRSGSSFSFQQGDSPLFLISLKAGGVGLNLTAADYVIHLDPWWKPAIEDQASDRTHRIGQTRPVTIYRLISQDTIEEKIIELHRNKRSLADSLLEGSNLSHKLTLEDLLALLGGRD